MSVVIAVRDKENGSIWMGCDSAISNLEEIRTIKMPKMFHHNDITIGFAGSARVGQVLMHYRWEKVEDLEDLINTIKDILEETGALNNTPDGDQAHKSTLLVIYKNEIYEIDEMFQVIDADEDYSAIGGGKSYALGSLYSTDDVEMTAQERLVKALECSEFYSPFVRGPFKIMEIPNGEKRKASKSRKK